MSSPHNSEVTQERRKKEAIQITTGSRKKRSDAGIVLCNDRDEQALTWIGQQYAIRLDHLQWLLGSQPGRGAQHEAWISEGAARAVVTRWKSAGWVQAERIRAKEPFWVWLTHRGLRKMGLPYTSNDLEHTDLDALRHLHAINAIRLQLTHEQEGIRWISERQLLSRIVRRKGQTLLHRSDGEIHYSDGDIIAIEAEISSKGPFKLAENLMELLRGKEYLRLKDEYGWQQARMMSQSYESEYDQIWYFAPKKVRRLVYNVRAKLVSVGDLDSAEAERLVVRWYPLTQTDEEIEQEEQEDREARRDPALLDAPVSIEDDD